MIRSCDSGSLPFAGDPEIFPQGAVAYGRVVSDPAKFFEMRVVDSFCDKILAGIDIPNYPQYRDMVLMFYDMIEGIGKVSGSYIETGPLSLIQGRAMIPEVLAISSCSEQIRERTGEPFQLRICVTGPYTLSSLFALKDKGSFTRLGNVLAQIIEANIFSNKHGTVQLVSVDEPAFGFVDDPLLDRGSEARENLLKAWELMMQKIRAKGAQPCLHLHNTSDELFWEVRSLSVIESHANSGFYQSKRTKDQLESADKFLKASVAVTDFDELIRNKITRESQGKPSETVLNEKVADAWKNLSKKQIEPVTLLEDTELMRERLQKIVEYFGEDRVPYAGPECGLRSFPTYESALECLRRASRAIKGG